MSGRSSTCSRLRHCSSVLHVTWWCLTLRRSYTPRMCVIVGTPRHIISSRSLGIIRRGSLHVITSSICIITRYSLRIVGLASLRVIGGTPGCIISRTSLGLIPWDPCGIIARSCSSWPRLRCRIRWCTPTAGNRSTCSNRCSSSSTACWKCSMCLISKNRRHQICCFSKWPNIFNRCWRRRTSTTVDKISLQEKELCF